jgi:hypothetical protein
MNTTEQFAELPPDERLNAEKEVLKLKLGFEYGFNHPDLKTDDDYDFEFMENLYEFERQFAEHKDIRVYDMVGRPEFRYADEMTSAEISEELPRIIEYLNENNVDFTTLCEYDDETIYRFITEELFDHHTDDIRIPGMTVCFIYEEFHPNHDYDIRRCAEDFIKALIREKWNEYHSIYLDKTICFNDHSFGEASFIQLIHSFQEEKGSMRLQNWKPLRVKFDLDEGLAFLEGALNYKEMQTGCLHEGIVMLEFKMKYDYWGISCVKIPGFGC